MAAPPPPPAAAPKVSSRKTPVGGGAKGGLSFAESLGKRHLKKVDAPVEKTALVGGSLIVSECVRMCENVYE
jgi:hypothetical protein